MKYKEIYLQYILTALNNETKEINAFEISYQVRVDDIVTRANPGLLKNQIKQNFLIEHPEYDRNDFPITVFFKGDLIKI